MSPLRRAQTRRTDREKCADVPAARISQNSRKLLENSGARLGSGCLGGGRRGMDMATYLTADEYSKALTTRLDEFYEALTFRWREEACKALSKTVFDVPGAPEPLRWQPQPESHGHL